MMYFARQFDDGDIAVDYVADDLTDRIEDYLATGWEVSTHAEFSLVLAYREEIYGTPNPPTFAEWVEQNYAGQP